MLLLKSQFTVHIIDLCTRGSRNDSDTVSDMATDNCRKLALLLKQFNPHIGLFKKKTRSSLTKVFNAGPGDYDCCLETTQELVPSTEYDGIDDIIYSCRFYVVDGLTCRKCSRHRHQRHANLLYSYVVSDTVHRVRTSNARGQDISVT